MSASKRCSGLLRLVAGIVLLFQAVLAGPAAAQGTTPAGPVYIIQPGDSLSSIASRFNISLTDLMAANNITDANSISAGASLVIPGLEGLSGTLVTDIVDYGDSLNSLSRRHQIDPALLRRLNHITSPSELYAGISLVVLQQTDDQALSSRFSLIPGETLLEAAVRLQSDPWALSSVNQLDGAWAAMPGDVLYAPVANGDEKATGLPAVFESAEISPLPLVQGTTAVIKVRAQSGAALGGMLVDRPLHFFPTDDGGQVALQGIYGLLQPGVYPLRLEATLSDGSRQSFEQMVVVQSGGFPSEKLVVDPAMIDPAVTVPELDQLVALTAPATPQKSWQGPFASPASQFPDGLCFSSRYGTVRSYNNGPFDAFHTGLDFCGGTGLPITSPAGGTVIFAGPLTVRGNAVVVDHGWGVYSGFWHQSEVKVKTGDVVQTGQVLGIVGGTGRVTGPHLHWEVWVNGIQVNPIDWLQNNYP